MDEHACCVYLFTSTSTIVFACLVAYFEYIAIMFIYTYLYIFALVIQEWNCDIIFYRHVYRRMDNISWSASLTLLMVTRYRLQIFLYPFQCSWFFFFSQYSFQFYSSLYFSKVLHFAESYYVKIFPFLFVFLVCYYYHVS